MKKIGNENIELSDVYPDIDIKELENKRFRVSDIYVASVCTKSIDERSITYSGDMYAHPFIKISDKLYTYNGVFSIKQIVSTRNNEKSSISLEEFHEWIKDKEKEPEYKNRPYAFIVDIQNFGSFLQQLGIDIENLEDIRLGQAQAIMRNWHTELKIELIKKYIGINPDKIFVGNDIFNGDVMQQILEAVRKGNFKVSPSFFNLKQKNLFKRIVNKYGKKNRLLLPNGEDDFLSQIEANKEKKGIERYKI